MTTKNGESPTPENSTRLNGSRGRGSIVWLNQSSPFQTSELDTRTVREAQEQGLAATSDAGALIDEGLFPS